MPVNPLSKSAKIALSVILFIVTSTTLPTLSLISFHGFSELASLKDSEILLAAVSIDTIFILTLCDADRTLAGCTFLFVQDNSEL